MVVSGQLHASTVYPRRVTPVHTEQEAEWVQSLSGGFGEEINTLPMQGIEPTSLWCPASSTVTLHTVLSRLTRL